MRDRAFYSICFGFLLGVLLRSFILVDLYITLLILLVAAALLFYFSLLKYEWEIISVVFILACCIGVFRFNMVDIPAPTVFESQVGQKATFTGEIIDEPSIGETDQKLTVETQVGKDKTKILLATAANADYKYGDIINFTGKLAKPQNFITAQGKEFDYINYLRKDGVLYVISFPKIDTISRGNGNFIKSALFSIKENFLAKMYASIPKPESIFMDGLILGEKSAFDKQFLQSFITTGTIHIVALSGYNVTIVAEWIMKLFSFLPRNLGIGMGIFAILLFIIMTGGSSTVVRAGIMAVLALIARATGRTYEVGRILVLTAALMILFNPLLLAFDTSFELSFISTIAVIFFTPKIEKYFWWVTKKGQLRDIITVTCAAYTVVTPFILYKMGNLSLVALPTNVLILPFVPFTMILGFLTGIFGFLSPFAALPFAYISYGFLHYELAVISFFASLPFAAVIIKNFPLILTILVYIFFAYIIFVRKNDPVIVKKENTTDIFALKNFYSPIFFGVMALAVIISGLFYYGHFQKNHDSGLKLQALLSVPISLPVPSLGKRVKEANCKGAVLPDTDCTPGAVFTSAGVKDICVSGYTQTVRNVSTNLRKKVYAEYGVSYPQARGAYEVDHLIPLELGGSNDIPNLFLEAAKPTPGFHEKDLVENFLNQEVCAGRADLARSQYQIATDWTAVYNNLTLDQITALKQQYRNWSGN